MNGLNRRCLVPLLAAGLLASAPAAQAHNAAFVVSRDSTAHPRLGLHGPRDYLDGRTCITLRKGDDVLRGYWFCDAPGLSSLNQDGLVRGRLRLQPRNRMALELVRADPGFAMLEPSTWNVVLARRGQTYEFVRDPGGQFSIQMIARVPRPGHWSATFRFVDKAGLSAPSDPFTLCFTTDLAADPAGVPVTLASTYLDAVQELRKHLVAAEASIPADKLSLVSYEASALHTLAESVPGLAGAPDTGVPAVARAAVGSHAAALIAVTVPLHQSADLGDMAGAVTQLQAAGVLVDSLEAYAPRRYTCPMGDLDGRTYPAPGNCPVCGMKLMDTLAHLDHTPRHGGAFMMTPDFRHHLEAVVGAARELRVYFYDEFTKPIAAQSIRARVELARSGAGPAPSIALAPGPEPACLVATLPAQNRNPHSLTLVVDFGDGQGEQSYFVAMPGSRR